MEIMFELLANIEEALDKKEEEDNDFYLGRIPLNYSCKLMKYGSVFV